MIIERLKNFKIIKLYYQKLFKIFDLLNIRSYFVNSIIFLWKIKYYFNRMTFFSQFIRRGDLCFDIGANIGDKTRIFLMLGAKVVSVEPQITCLKKLYEIFGNNKNVIIVNKAIGEKERYGDLQICDNYHTLSTLSKDWTTKSKYSKKFTWTETQRVKIITLDTLIKSYGLAKFCKIDVEGFEANVIKGLNQIIHILCFEFHKEFLNELKKCIDHLESLGTPKFNFVLGEGTELHLSEWVNSDNLYNILNSIKKEELWGDIFVKFD